MKHMEMTAEREARILEKAVSTYGAQAQTDMMIEEMSELTKALCKYRREATKNTFENVLEEMADVQIMLNQMALIFDDCTEQKIGKLERLERRLGLDTGEERSEAPLDWEAAKEHLDTYEAEYSKLPDGQGLFGLMHICGIRSRYENGERTPELYQDMMAIE